VQARNVESLATRVYFTFARCRNIIAPFFVVNESCDDSSTSGRIVTPNFSSRRFSAAYTSSTPRNM
jgi:hypothetical protein